jgi:Holliday junction DNA helicase RuvB
MKLIGNIDILSQLEISLRSAVKRFRAIPHTLLTGAAGCGKTSTARYMTELTGWKFISVACDSIKARADVLALIKKLDHIGYDKFGRHMENCLIRPTIVFLDEIHNLSLAAQEHLGILMEEWCLPISSKEADLMKINMNEKKDATGLLCWAPQFTLIGATTNDGKLSKPFRDRFKLRFVFTPYSLEESIQIVFSHADRLKISIDQSGALEIAQRGRGVPRVLVSLLERCRDAAITMHEESITKELAIVAFYYMGIDLSGLTRIDTNLLVTLYDIAAPVGIDNLATILNESPKVISEAIEPYLIQRGLMLRSSKGRTVTDKGRKYLIDGGHIKQKPEHEKFAITKSFDRGF